MPKSAEKEDGLAVLAGRVGVVTGAGSGIGQAVAIAAGRAGAAGLILADRDEDGLAATKAAAGPSVASIIVRSELTHEVDVAAMVSKARDLGRFDFAVNVAGITGTSNSIASTAADHWREVIEVNLTAGFLCLKHELKLFGELGGGGSIVIVGASIGALVAVPGLAAYAASKAGLAMLARVAALEAAEIGVRVNTLAPGGTRTPMTANIDPAMTGALEKRHPLGRFAEPAEIAAAAVWLVSDAASFVTGALLAVDGGFSTGLAGG